MVRIIRLLIFATIIALAVAVGYPFVRAEIVKSKVRQGKPIHSWEYTLAKNKFPDLLKEKEASHGGTYPVIEWKNTMQPKPGAQAKTAPSPPSREGVYYKYEKLTGK